jgi:GNAT superfamily N-acetyltransferase
MRIALINLTKFPRANLIGLLTDYARVIDGDDEHTFPTFIEHHLAGRPDGPHQVTPTDCCGTYVLAGEMDGPHLLGTVTVRIEHDDERGGWLGQSVGLDGLWLAGINVPPTHRRQGYARLMLDRLRDEIECRSVGAEPVRVNLCTENPVAAALYESEGWEKVAAGVPYANRLTTIYTTTVQPGWITDADGELIPSKRFDVVMNNDPLTRIATHVTPEAAQAALVDLETHHHWAEGLLAIQPGQYRVSI